MAPSNQRPSQPTPSQARPLPRPFLTGREIAGALALYASIALIPPAPFERPWYLLRLIRPAPTHVPVPVGRVATASAPATFSASAAR